MVIFKLTVIVVNGISNFIKKIMIKIRRRKHDKNLGTERVIPTAPTNIESDSEYEFQRPEVKVWGSK